MSPPLPKSVLVVDDEVEVAKALRRVLRREFDVEIAHTGAEALAKLAQRPFDLVLSDYRMPGMNGAELLGEVKCRMPACARVMLSGFADFDSVCAAVNEGEIIRFLRKPWDNEQLMAELRKVLAGSDLAAALYHPFRAVPAGVHAELVQTETAARVEVKMQGGTFDHALALGLIRKFLGAITEHELGLVGGLVERHAGKLSFVANVGGEQRLTLEVPLVAGDSPPKDVELSQ